MDRTLAEMIAPVTSEADATMVSEDDRLTSEVFGEKSQVVDNSLSRIAKDVYGLASEIDPLSAIHVGLAGAGMIPAIGNVADLIDASIYGLEGKGGDAALSLAAAVPFIGQGATAGRIAKTLKKGKDLFKKSNVADVSKLGKKTGDILPSGKTFKMGKRDVTTVAVRNADGSISHQPFYKSTGTSGDVADWRKDKWMPFIGNMQKRFYKGRVNLKGKPVSHMVESGKQSLGELKHILEGDIKKRGFSKKNILHDFNIRYGGDIAPTTGTGRMVRMSDELSKLEKGFKQTGEGGHFGALADWIGGKNLGDLRLYSSLNK